MERLRSRFEPKLQHLVRKIQLQELSRVPASRLEETALPKIGLVELVSASVFEGLYNKLYLSMFHGGERERSDLIIDRLRDDFAGRRAGLAPYRIIGLRDHNGEAVGAAQLSVLMLPSATAGKDTVAFAVPYLNYIYVRPQNRRQDMSEILHTLVLAVAAADAKQDARVVPFTLFETEPPNHGVEQAGRTNATERTMIHSKSGARAMMLRRRGDGKIVTAHIQPGLEPGDSPLTLVWALRPSPRPAYHDSNLLGRAIIAAYYRSLRDEGFPEDNISLAERVAAKRCEDADFIDMPLSEVTADMYQNMGDDGYVQ